MKFTPWIIAAVSAAVIVHILQDRQLRTALPDDTETDNLSRWGARQSTRGRLQYAGGTIERGAAELLDNERLEVDGIIDQLAGGISVAAGRTAQIVQHEIDDLDR